MGTNFYLHQYRLNKHDYPDTGFHIGKRSCGWVFHFEAHERPHVKTVEEMRQQTFNGYIYDEYGTEYTYEQFWKEVEETKEPDVDGRPNYVLVDPEYPHVISPSVEWEDEGFAFTLSDFC